MNVIEFFTELATSIPDQSKLSDLMKNLPAYVQQAIKNNDFNLIRESISGARFYANETKVAIY